MRFWWYVTFSAFGYKPSTGNRIGSLVGNIAYYVTITLGYRTVPEPPALVELLGFNSSTFLSKTWLILTFYITILRRVPHPTVNSGYVLSFIKQKHCILI